MDSLKIESKISAVVESKKKDLELLNTLIESHLLAEDQLIGQLIDTVKKHISLQEHKIRKDIRSLADLYLIGKLISTKIKSLEEVLLTRSYIKRPKTPSCVLRLSQKYKDHILYFSDQVLCGKNQEASDKIYHKTSHQKWNYYHAKVHGGGLIAIKEENNALGNSLATLYSQYLKRVGSPLGVSAHSVNISKSRDIGSFCFKTPTTLIRTMLNLYVCIDKVPVENTLSFKLSYEKEEGKLNFLIGPNPRSYKSRYDDVINYYANKNIKVKNFECLDLIVPRLYQLVLC